MKIRPSLLAPRLLHARPVHLVPRSEHRRVVRLPRVSRGSLFPLLPSLFGAYLKLKVRVSNTLPTLSQNAGGGGRHPEQFCGITGVGYPALSVPPLVNSSLPYNFSPASPLFASHVTKRGVGGTLLSHILKRACGTVCGARFPGLGAHFPRRSAEAASCTYGHAQPSGFLATPPLPGRTVESRHRREGRNHFRRRPHQIWQARDGELNTECSPG